MTLGDSLATGITSGGVANSEGKVLLGLPPGQYRGIVSAPSIFADRGLELMRDAGHDVVVRLDLSPEELIEAIAPANALVIRSATQVTAEVLEAGRDLVVVGRAGIGLDNVDTAAATRLGVMVVNAPQSNILSAAEHTLALLLAQARNIPQAHAALVSGRWERSKWEGVELHGKTLGIVGLGRVGALVAQRALAFGMRLCAYDPYVSADRARHMSVEMLPLERAGRRRRTSSRSTFRRLLRRSGSSGASFCSTRKARTAHREHRTRRDHRRGRRWPMRSARVGSRARASTCSRSSRRQSRRCSSSRRSS